MNALILSAGYGKRLKPITLAKPKCLVRIKGEPIISIWIENLIKGKLETSISSETFT